MKSTLLLGQSGNREAPELVCVPSVTSAYFKKFGATIIEAEMTGIIMLQGEEFTLPVSVMTHEQFFALLTQKPFPRDYECRIGDRMYPFFSPKEGTAKISDQPIEVRSETTSETSVQKILGPVFLKFLEEVSTYVLGGMNIILHPYLPSAMHAPIKDRNDTIHIFLGCTPISKSGYINPPTTFGIHVYTQDGYEACFLPSPRRSIILSDGTHDVVQIIGNNIYLLFDPFRLHSLGTETTSVIFQKTIALAINGWIKKVELTENEDEDPMTVEGLEALAIAFCARQKNAATEIVKARQEKISKIEESLREAKRDLAHIVRFYRCLEQGEFHRHGADRLILDHAHMLLHPLVERIIIIPEEGVEIQTKMIRIDHEEKTYRIGRFFIRFGFDDPLLIWAEESCHPNGEPHPHLSAQNGPCFGNVSGAIDDAIVEYRYADALDYIMMWLTSYTPELVIWHKIEEWPSEEICATPTTLEIGVGQ